MTELFCTVFLLTAGCADDLLVITPLPGSDWCEVTTGEQTDSWVVTGSTVEVPLGCYAGVVEVSCYGDSIPPPTEPWRVIWAADPGRAIEFDATACVPGGLTNDPTCYAPLCGGP